MFGRRGKSKYGSLAKSYGGLSASAKRKRARSQKTFGKKNLSSNIVVLYLLLKRKHNHHHQRLVHSILENPKHQVLLVENPFASTKPAPAVVKKPKFTVLIPRQPPPAPPAPQPKPRPKPSFVKRQQPKPKAVVKSRPANTQPRGQSSFTTNGNEG